MQRVIERISCFDHLAKRSHKRLLCQWYKCRTDLNLLWDPKTQYAWPGPLLCAGTGPKTYTWCGIRSYQGNILLWHRAAFHRSYPWSVFGGPSILVPLGCPWVPLGCPLGTLIATCPIFILDDSYICKVYTTAVLIFFDREKSSNILYLLSERIWAGKCYHLPNDIQIVILHTASISLIPIWLWELTCIIERTVCDVALPLQKYLKASPQGRFKRRTLVEVRGRGLGRGWGGLERRSGIVVSMVQEWRWCGEVEVQGAMCFNI